jgi:hypothetical protein
MFALSPHGTQTRVGNMPAPAPTNETTVTDQNITQYLLERVPQFRRLTKLREKVGQIKGKQSRLEFWDTNL